MIKKMKLSKTQKRIIGVITSLLVLVSAYLMAETAIYKNYLGTVISTVAFIITFISTYSLFDIDIDKYI